MTSNVKKGSLTAAAAAADADAVALEEEEETPAFVSFCNLEALRYAILDLELLQSDFNEVLSTTLNSMKKVESNMSALFTDNTGALNYRDLSKAVRPMTVAKQNFNLQSQQVKNEIDTVSNDLRNITYSLKNALRLAKQFNSK